MMSTRTLFASALLAVATASEYPFDRFDQSLLQSYTPDMFVHKDVTKEECLKACLGDDDCHAVDYGLGGCYGKGKASFTSNTVVQETSNFVHFAKIPQPKRMVVYFEAWTQPESQVFDMDWTRMTHVNYAFANITDGEVVLGQPQEDTMNVEPMVKGVTNETAGEDGLKGNMQALVLKKKEFPHVKTLISVGGWTWSGLFSPAARTPESREKFAKSAAVFVEKYHFDGLDLDWEYPVAGGMGGPGHVWHPDDLQNYDLLLQACRVELNKLSGPKRLLTVAITANVPKLQANHQLDRLQETLDFITVMTYDFNGAWDAQTGHNSPLYCDPRAAIDQFCVDFTMSYLKNQGLNKEKFVVGMPSYGRGWHAVQASAVKPSLAMPNTHGMYAPASPWWGSFSYHFVRQLVAGEGPDVTVNDTFTRHWDSVAQAPFVFGDRGDTKNVLISYDDAESLTHKGIYAYQGGWGGAMTWAASSDYKTELQRIMYETAVEGKDWSTLAADPIAP